MSNNMNIIEKNCHFSYKCELDSDNRKVDWETLEFAVGRSMLLEEVKELTSAILDKDEVEVLDGAYDVAVIALNIAYKLFRMKGDSHEVAVRKAEQGFHRVLDSNLSKIKLDGSVEFKECGKKVKKPDTFCEPHFDDLLNQQKDK